MDNLDSGQGTDFSIPYGIRPLPPGYQAPSIGSVNLFDTANLDAPATNGVDPTNQAVASVWDKLATAPTSAVNAIESGASTIWTGAKTEFTSVFDSVEGEISSAVGDTVAIVALGIVVLLGVIWVIGKSGIIGQAAPLAKAGGIDLGAGGGGGV